MSTKVDTKVDFNKLIDLFWDINTDKFYRVTRTFHDVFYDSGRITILDGSILRVTENNELYVIITIDNSETINELRLKWYSPRFIDRLLEDGYPYSKDIVGLERIR